MSNYSNAAKELARIKALIPVIEAFLKGEEVEYKFEEFTTWMETDDPLWLKDCEYRIKPKPLVLYATRNDQSGVTVYLGESKENAESYISHRSAALRVVKLVEEL